MKMKCVFVGKEVVSDSLKARAEKKLSKLDRYFNKEAEDIWQIAISEGATSPMTYYYLGRYDEAMATDIAYCFPNRPEAVAALEAAKQSNPKDAHAPYLLGCLYYAARQYDLAMDNWRLSAELDPDPVANG